MLSPRRFPPPWTVEDACFIVRDNNGHELGYFYFRSAFFLFRQLRIRINCQFRANAKKIRASALGGVQSYSVHIFTKRCWGDCNLKPSSMHRLIPTLGDADSST